VHAVISKCEWLHYVYSCSLAQITYLVLLYVQQVEDGYARIRYRGGRKVKEDEVFATSYIYYTIHNTICDACSNTVCQSVAQAISMQ
jgi:glycopeptide antibiotics resistance protein